MNKEEISFKENKEFWLNIWSKCSKEELKLKLYTSNLNNENLQSQLTQANSKIEKIREYIKYLEQLEKTNNNEFLKDSYMIVHILKSIIGEE